MVAEPGSRRGGRAVAAQCLVHYQTAVVTTWRCGCCYEVIMVEVVVSARGTANERYGVVERRTSRAVVTVHAVLVAVGCQLVT